MALVEALLVAGAPLSGNRSGKSPEKRKARAADSCARRSTQGRSRKMSSRNYPNAVFGANSPEHGAEMRTPVFRQRDAKAKSWSKPRNSRIAWFAPAGSARL
jgi:hypothetical protein